MSLTVASFLGTTGVFILLAWSIYLVWRVGQLHNGCVFTMLIGAYFSSYATGYMGWPFGLALITAVGMGALATFLPALRLARVPAFTTAIATIALIFIAQAAVRDMDFLGGASGLYHTPRVSYGLPLIYMTLVIVGFFIYRLEHSRVGRAMEAIFVDPDLGASLGVDTYKVRIFCHTVAGALGALAGVFYAFTVGSFAPVSFGFGILLAVYCFLFVGGSSTMWGTVIFTPILWAGTNFLPEHIARSKDLIYGSLLMAILILRPEGAIDKEVLRAISTKSQAWLRRLRGYGKAGEAY